MKQTENQEARGPTDWTGETLYAELARRLVADCGPAVVTDSRECWWYVREHRRHVPSECEWAWETGMAPRLGGSKTSLSPIAHFAAIAAEFSPCLSLKGMAPFALRSMEEAQRWWMDSESAREAWTEWWKHVGKAIYIAEKCYDTAARELYDHTPPRDTQTPKGFCDYRDAVAKLLVGQARKNGWDVGDPFDGKPTLHPIPF